jgi:meso-butanediol dehydrogenase / (S,S)-butanediol dehydrogenase / diacetyl reductase
VADPDADRALVDEVAAGHGRLDVLVNVAGVLRFAHATDHSRDDWDRMLAVNLSGPWFLMQAALPHLEATRGNIVNVASAAGLVGQAYTSAYCASKGGLVLLTKSLAIEYASRKVRVNAVCPGQVNTNLLADFTFPEGADQRLLDRLLPLVRGAAPEEIATLIAFLASDEARYVTGAAWPVDGGQTAG